VLAGFGRRPFIGQDNCLFLRTGEMAISWTPTRRTERRRAGRPHPAAGARRQQPHSLHGQESLVERRDQAAHGPRAPQSLHRDQLRAHFFSLGLALRSVSFRPLALNPAPERAHRRSGAQGGQPPLQRVQPRRSAPASTQCRIFRGKLPAGSRDRKCPARRGNRPQIRVGDCSGAKFHAVIARARTLHSGDHEDTGTRRFARRTRSRKRSEARARIDDHVPHGRTAAVLPPSGRAEDAK